MAEGTNSYGAGLAHFLASAGMAIREVIRPKRAQRRRGKSEGTPTFLGHAMRSTGSSANS